MPESTFEPEIQSSLCINGSRAFGKPMEVQRIVEIQMAAVMRDSTVKTVYTGGADGIDSLCLKTLRAFRERVKGDGPYLIVVCPCTEEELPPMAREVARRCADRIIELENRITLEDGWQSFKTRNNYMVEHSCRLQSFWNGESEKSGTTQAAQYARSLGKGVEIISIPSPRKGPQAKVKALLYKKR